MNRPVYCDNCNWTGTEETLGRTLFDCEHLWERLSPGSEVPAGECPKCHSFAYLKTKPQNRLPRLYEELKVNADDIYKIVEYDDDADSSYADQEGMEQERAAIDRGDLVAFGVRAAIKLKLRSGNEVPLVSPGLWGIFAESSHDPYMDEVFKEERATVISMLEELGIEVEGK